MTANMANAAMVEHEVHFAYFHDQFGTVLDDFVSKVRLRSSSKIPLAGLREPFSLLEIGFVWRLINKIAPDVVIVSQGNIEFSLKGLIASKLAARLTVSYLPLAFDLAFVKQNKLHRIRDWVNRIYYSLPDTFLVPSQDQKILVQMRVPHKNVNVIENAVSTVTSDPCKGRRGHEVSVGRSLSVGVVGRIDFLHKNTRILRDIAEQLRDRGVEWCHFHVFGTGPDEAELRQLIKERDLSHYFTWHGWTDQGKLHSWMKQSIDLVLILSHFESSPNLVFLEAAALGVPVLASNIPSFDSYLPMQYLIDQNNPSAICARLMDLDLDLAQADIRKIWCGLEGLHSPEKFGIDVCNYFGQTASPPK
jgi:glycosyltransferase involved in cell wall biosynthesis